MKQQNARNLQAFVYVSLFAPLSSEGMPFAVAFDVLYISFHKLSQLLCTIRLFFLFIDIINILVKFGDLVFYQGVLISSKERHMAAVS